jgi:DnaJ-class molecular chaperone
MEKMISHVTQNVFKMMNNSGGEEMDTFSLIPPELLNTLNKSMKIVESQNESESESENIEYLFPKTRDICFDLNVELEDFYNGKKKKLNVKRKRIIEVDGKQKVIEEKKKLIIPIEKGMRDEQQIRFEGEADQIPGYKPGDIIITLIENEHPVFQRDNDNLIIVKNINLYEIYNLTFEIKHLDNRILRIHKNENDALQLDSLRKISGEGMPSYKSRGDFGDLFIRFNLNIPKSLEPKQLASFREMFYVQQKLSEFSKECILEQITESELEEFENYTSSESELDTTDSSDTLSDSSDSLSDLSSVSSEEIKVKKYPKKR